MAIEPPPQGSVILYPYLWVRQRDAAETEGRKTRPACLVLRMRDQKRELHHLAVLAVSSQPPGSDQAAVEVPDTERRRAGLSRYPRAWVVVSEYNYDIAEQSWYYEPGRQPPGEFSAPFLREIAKAFRAALLKTTARVDPTR
jgi:hypothetical protein